MRKTMKGVESRSTTGSKKTRRKGEDPFSEGSHLAKVVHRREGIFRDERRKRNGGTRLWSLIAALREVSRLCDREEDRQGALS